MTAIRWLASTIAVAFCASPAVALAAGLVFTPPLDPAANYPAQALHEGIEGRAVVACLLGADGALSQCTIEVDEPQGYGFGAASISVVMAARLDIAASGLGHSVGQRVAVPLVFKLGSHPRPTDTSPAS